MADVIETRLRLIEALTRTDGRMARDEPVRLIAALEQLERYVHSIPISVTDVAINETAVVQPPQARRGRPPKSSGTDADKDGHDLLA